MLHSDHPQILRRMLGLHAFNVTRASGSVVLWYTPPSLDTGPLVLQVPRVVGGRILGAGMRWLWEATRVCRIDTTTTTTMVGG